MNDNPTVTVGGKECLLENLSGEARAPLANVQMADQEIARLNTQLTLVQTAPNAYALALAVELPKN
ncbi:hypothetical protein TM1040_3838 (plasmid) [Ruegeria sp. TM1040]|uniref:DUF6447 family protein n=1 Tax=Ruegeria sp. (strain TM1040) TaxID=292414 RepID=UPI0000D7C74B|nr:DUF6447 family protein [Ruegeria sp. TM1040]ABF61968.1 hypothetical protein TM1040_3838 [Ruegeria sp. TM1040]